jgi:IclR family pca regulon transcriptional regulator
MGGLAKGLAIIECFDHSRDRLTVSEAARLTATSPAAARRCLLTLTSLGYLVHDGKFFRPTPRLARLGASYDIATPLATLAQPFLEEVRDACSESVSLAVLDGESSLFVARAEASRIVSLGGRVGSRLPAHGSATGRVLLAALPEDELDRRLDGLRPVATTPRTLVAIPAIRERIRAAHECGFSITEEELEVGVNTMAVAVRDTRGRVQAAMSVAVFAARLSVPGLTEEILPLLRGAADRLGAML